MAILAALARALIVHKNPRVVTFSIFLHLTSVKVAARGALVWTLLLIGWLIFAASLDVQEWIAGTFAAAIGVLAFQVSNRAEPLCFSPSFKALLEAWRLPASILHGTWILVVELARRMGGKRGRAAFRQAPFHATGADSRSAARRTLAVIYGTLPPNSLIVGIDRKAGLILFHQLRKEPLPQIVRSVESA